MYGKIGRRIPTSAKLMTVGVVNNWEEIQNVKKTNFSSKTFAAQKSILNEFALTRTMLPNLTYFSRPFWFLKKRRPYHFMPNGRDGGAGNRMVAVRLWPNHSGFDQPW